MLIAYTYKLKVSLAQGAKMGRWLHLLRLQYNYRLHERIEAYEMSFRCGVYCDLETKAEIQPLACSVSKGALYGEFWKTDKKTGKSKRRSAYEIQSSDLPNLKKERSWYKEVYSNCTQQMLRHLDTAFQNFFKHGFGYPKFKRKSKFKSFTYTPSDCEFKGNKVRLPGIGWVRFFKSRSFPTGFALRSVTVRQKADGWYISVRLQDDSVPTTPAPSEDKTAIGVDMGINKLMALSNGEVVQNPRFLARQERRHRIRQRHASRKILGSKNRGKAYQYLAKLDNMIAKQREDWQWKAAQKLVEYDLIVLEALNVKNMMKRCKPKWDEEQQRYVENGQSRKSGLNKAISDASWASLKQKTLVLSARTGSLVYEINPRHTSQECSQCGYVSPTNRNREKFLCESCGYAADADIDAAVVILNRGLFELKINLDAVRGDTSKQGKKTPTETSTWNHVEPGNRQPIKFKTLIRYTTQASLIGWESRLPESPPSLRVGRTSKL